MTAYDLFVSGRPSVDVMFAGLNEWPALGNDVDATRLGVCAGTSFNTPASANRLGLRVAYVTTIGDDVWSRMIAAEFAAEGLSTDFLETLDRPLPGVSVAMNFDGDRGFVTHWGSDAEYAERLEARALDVVRTIDAPHLHGYVDESPALEAAAAARGMTVSLDTWGGPWFSTNRPLEEALAHADVLFANETEARAMADASSAEEALETLARHCGCVVIKRAGLGAVGIADGVAASVGAYPTEVVDTTGAGDCFNAGFLAGWLRGLGLEGSLTLGGICAARSLADFGGYRGCPREPELRQLAAARGIVVPEGEARRR